MRKRRPEEVHSTNQPQQIIYSVLAHHRNPQLFSFRELYYCTQETVNCNLYRDWQYFLRKYKCISGNEFIAVELKNI